jgi:hypothetical protein
MHAFAKVLAPRGGRTEAARDPRKSRLFTRGRRCRWGVLLSSAALRAHLPAHVETRATAALAISTRSNAGVLCSQNKEAASVGGLCRTRSSRT